MRCLSHLIWKLEGGRGDATLLEKEAGRHATYRKKRFEHIDGGQDEEREDAAVRDPGCYRRLRCRGAADGSAGTQG